MMSNNNMLGGPREASQTTPQPNTTSVNQLIQIELEGLTLRNVALGLAIYVAISIVLFIVGTQSVATLHQWLWLSAVSCTGLSIWLWLANAKRAGNLSPSSTQIAIYSSAVICAALWGAASPLFIQADQLEATALVMIILITLSFPWLLLFHYRRFFQQVVLSLIYVPLLATLYIKYPQQPAFLALIVVVYGLLTVCAMDGKPRASPRNNCQHAQIQGAGAENRSNQPKDSQPNRTDASRFYRVEPTARNHYLEPRGNHHLWLFQTGSAWPNH